MSYSKLVSSKIDPQNRDKESDSEDEVVVLETPVKIIETISLIDSEDEQINYCSADQRPNSIASSRSTAPSQATVVSTSAESGIKSVTYSSKSDSSPTLDYIKEEKEMDNNAVKNLFNNPYVNPLLDDAMVRGLCHDLISTGQCYWRCQCPHVHEMGGLLICSVFQNLCKDMCLEKAMKLFLTFASASTRSPFSGWLFTEPGRCVVEMVIGAHLDCPFHTASDRAEFVARVLGILADDTLAIPLLRRVVENVILATEPTECTAALLIQLYTKVLQYFQLSAPAWDKVTTILASLGYWDETYAAVKAAMNEHNDHYIPPSYVVEFVFAGALYDEQRLLLVCRLFQYAKQPYLRTLSQKSMWDILGALETFGKTSIFYHFAERFGINATPRYEMYRSHYNYSPYAPNAPM